MLPIISVGTQHKEVRRFYLKLRGSLCCPKYDSCKLALHITICSPCTTLVSLVHICFHLGSIIPIFMFHTYFVACFGCSGCIFCSFFSICVSNRSHYIFTVCYTPFNYLVELFVSFCIFHFVWYHWVLLWLCKNGIVAELRGNSCLHMKFGSCSAQPSASHQPYPIRSLDVKCTKAFACSCT